MLNTNQKMVACAVAIVGLLFFSLLVPAQELENATFAKAAFADQTSSLRMSRIPGRQRDSAKRSQILTQSCLPNDFCWVPGLPNCCSGSCTATEKCPGVQACLCD